MPAPNDLPFRTLSDCVRDHARARPGAIVLTVGDLRWTWRELDARVDRIAASLQRDGLLPGDVIAVCAHASLDYVALFLGALRAGLVVAPLAPSSTPHSLVAMLADAQPRWLFADAAIEPALSALAAAGVAVMALDAGLAKPSLEDWLLPAGASPTPVACAPDAAFNIIYSSGTTGTPKGIVQSHGMRWAHVVRAARFGYGHDVVTLLSTPLYSNTTLVVFFPTLATGGHVVLMPKFDAVGYLALAQKHRMTHTMLVPVQYQRLMALPAFEAFDLGATRYKFSTSAPFDGALKANVLRRWPGALVEFYGLTEGGGTCILEAHKHPDKLHTVGRPAPGHDLRLIDDVGHELPAGPPFPIGEVVGRSPGMMTGYHRQPEKTRDAEWFDAGGTRFIRTGDVGRFDADGFLTLLDRKKDMVISGGFNVYPSDLEAVLREHPGVAEAAVVGVPSRQWGETPVAFVVLRLPSPPSGQGSVVAAPDAPTLADGLLAWANARLGKTQRLAALHLLPDLPRSAIGKVLKRELRQHHLDLHRHPPC